MNPDADAGLNWRSKFSAFQQVMQPFCGKKGVD
jgi:hypothetical protein